MTSKLYIIEIIVTFFEVYMKYLNLIGRTSELFANDMYDQNLLLNELVSNGRFLVIGGAGSIGQAVTTEIFRRNP